MKVHFIAIGGSIMHGLALALHSLGHRVSGSDDKIYDPARSNLSKAGILPSYEGWNPDVIHSDLDCVILGMHAFEDNPELQKARSLNIPVYSFPEFIYRHALNKQRIVIGGSYGKTTITSMIMHVLKSVGKDFDYLVGSSVQGFEHSVRLSDRAPIMIIEGDEYLASKIEPEPKFIFYKAHIALISGISWDHINVFETEEIYKEQFRKFLHSLGKASSVIYCKEDKVLKKMVNEEMDKDLFYYYPYETPSYKVKAGKFVVKIGKLSQEMSVFGKHNMQNIMAAWSVCHLVGVEPQQFLEAMASFKGAGSRSEYIQNTDEKVVIKDYAHAPAKVAATVAAVRERYPKNHLVACLELHTFSSLNKKFLPTYLHTLKQADDKIVYVDPQAVERKRLEKLEESDILKAFGDNSIKFFTDAQQLSEQLHNITGMKTVFLMMSSGNFSGLDLHEI